MDSTNPCYFATLIAPLLLAEEGMVNVLSSQRLEGTNALRSSGLKAMGTFV